MHVVVYPIAAVVGWVAFFYTLWRLSKNWDNPPKRAVCISLFFPSVSFTIATPAIFAPIDHFIGFPNLTKLWVHGSLVIFSATVQRMLLMWTYPPAEARPKIRIRVIAAGVVLAVMAVLLILAPVGKPTSEFTETYATTPFVAEYLMVYLVAVGVGLAEISRLCWSYAKAANRPWVVRGLNITAVGAAIGIGYCLTKGVYVIGRNLGVNLAAVGASSPAFAALGAILVCVGLTLPSWGEPVERSLSSYSTYRALYPLWRAMFNLSPDIALDTPKSQVRARWSALDVTFRTIRREVEIMDGRMDLRGYLDPAVARQAREAAVREGLHGDEADAVGEAAMVKAGLQARMAGRARLTEVSQGTGGEARDETAWLVLVSQAFAHSPVVRDVAESAVNAPSSAARS